MDTQLARRIECETRRMIQIKGLIADARHLPRELQEKAHRKGLIPYIHGDRADDSIEE